MKKSILCNLNMRKLVEKERMIQYIKNNKFLYGLLKPIADFLWAIGKPLYFLYWGIINFSQGRVFPYIRKCLGSKDTKVVGKYKDIHKGKRIFVIASGPSLRQEDILKLKDEITIGVNGTIALFDQMDWQPTYFCISDEAVYIKYNDVIQRAMPQNAFIGINLKKYRKEMRFQPVFFDGYWKGSFFPFNANRLRKNMRFSEDIEKEGVYLGGQSIATLAVQFASYLGAKEIYLYGLDCDYGGATAHFDSSPKAADNMDDFTHSMFIFFEHAKEHCEKRGIQIYNATRGGKLELFPRVDLDNIVDINHREQMEV